MAGPSEPPPRRAHAHNAREATPVSAARGGAGDASEPPAAETALPEGSQHLGGEPPQRCLLTRSSRTLAWLGDAYMELRVRTLLASLGDYPVERLDLVRARMTCAEAQAKLLEAVRSELTEQELDVVNRAKNGGGRMTGRKLRDVKTYREATGFEALVAWWVHSDKIARLEQLLDARIEQLARDELARAARPRRG